MFDFFRDGSFGIVLRESASKNRSVHIVPNKSVGKFLPSVLYNNYDDDMKTNWITRALVRFLVSRVLDDTT